MDRNVNLQRSASQIVGVSLVVGLLVGCGQVQDQGPKETRESPQVQSKAVVSETAQKPAQSLSTPTPVPEPRVTLTTQTTLRELAAELTKQLGIEYAAGEEVAETTISVDFKNATRAEVETVVREKAKVRFIYSDRDIPEQWVHFAAGDSQ